MAMGMIGEEGMLGQNVYMQALDNSLALFTGEQAQANVVKLSTETNESVMGFSANVSKLLSMVNSLSPLFMQIPTEMCEPMQMQIDSMQASNGHGSFEMSFTNRGLEIQSQQTTYPSEVEITLCP